MSIRSWSDLELYLFYDGSNLEQTRKQFGILVKLTVISQRVLNQVGVVCRLPEVHKPIYKADVDFCIVPLEFFLSL